MVSVDGGIHVGSCEIKIKMQGRRNIHRSSWCKALLRRYFAVEFKPRDCACTKLFPLINIPQHIHSILRYSILVFQIFITHKSRRRAEQWIPFPKELLRSGSIEVAIETREYTRWRTNDINTTMTWPLKTFFCQGTVINIKSHNVSSEFFFFNSLLQEFLRIEKR